MIHNLLSSLLLFLLILFTLFIFIPAEAQSVWEEDAGVPILKSQTKSQIRKIVIMQDTVNWGHYILREKDFICYNLIESNEFIEGRVRRIHADTLFMNKQLVVLGNIDKIVKSHVRAPSFAVHRSRIFLFPDTAYHSVEAKLAYKHLIMRSVRDQKEINRTDTNHFNFIKFNLARLLGLEIAISYERKLSRYVSLDFEAAYGFPIYDRGGPAGGRWFVRFPYFPNRGFSILAGPKLYRLYKNKPSFYFEPLFQFKDLSYVRTYLPSDETIVSNSDNNYLWGDKYTTIYGISLRIGAMRKYRHVIIDYYAGAGLKVKDITCRYYYYYDYYDNKDRYFNDAHTPVVHNYTEIWPVFNLGIKMGFGF